MDIQEILTAIKDGKASTLTADATDIITAAIQAEKDKGIADSKKYNKEALSIKSKISALEKQLVDLGIDTEGDVESQINGLKEKLSKNGKVEPGSLAEIEERLKKESNDRIKSLETKWQKQIDDEKAEKLALQKRVLDKTASDILSKTMGDRYHAKDAYIKTWILENRVKPNDEGTSVVFVDGENEIGMEEYLKEFDKKNPEAIRNIQDGGSGGGVGRKVDISKNKRITNEQFNNLSLAEQKTYYASGGKVIEE